MDKHLLAHPASIQNVEGADLKKGRVGWSNDNIALPILRRGFLLGSRQPCITLTHQPEGERSIVLLVPSEAYLPRRSQYLQLIAQEVSKRASAIQ